MKRAWNHDGLTLDAAPLQFLRIGHCFIVEQVQRSYSDPGPGQTREVLAAGRHRVLWNGFRSAFPAKIRLPPKSIALPSPRNVAPVIPVNAERWILIRLATMNHPRSSGHVGSPDSQVYPMYFAPQR